MSINNDIAGQLNPAYSSPEIKWDKPEPIEKGLLPVPEFPSNILPDSMEKWIRDIAIRKDGAPVDFPAISAMVALSSLLGSKVLIHPKRYDEWSVIPNLWGAIIGNPSMKKTPCITDALKPIKNFEKKCFERYQDEMKDHQADLKLEKLQEKQFYGEVLKELKNNNSKAKEMLREAEYNAPEPPILKRYLVNDSTVEKLGEILSQNPSGTLHYRDELTGFLEQISKKDRAGERPFYLESWDGAGSYAFDRIGRGTVHIENLTLSIIGGIQPGKFKTYLEKRNQGFGDDGLIERFQLMVMPDGQTPKYTDQPVDEAARDKAYDVFNTFDAIPYEQGKPMIISFDNEGQEVFIDWYNHLIARIQAGLPIPSMKNHLSKYLSLMPTLACILSIADYGIGKPIDAYSAKKAWAWCDYLEAHARRIYAMASDCYAGARTLLSRFNQLPNPFTTADFSNRDWKHLTTASARNTALNTLCEKGYLHKDVVTTNSKPKIQYYINPLALDEP